MNGNVANTTCGEDPLNYGGGWSACSCVACQQGRRGFMHGCSGKLVPEKRKKHVLKRHGTGIIPFHTVRVAAMARALSPSIRFSLLQDTTTGNTQLLRAGKSVSINW